MKGTISPCKPAAPDAPRPWDARIARWLVRPLVGTWVRPNHLTTLRLLVGLAGVLMICRATYASALMGTALVALSNFLDHTDGELARVSGQGSRFGHLYDLGSDALITIGLFVAIGVAEAGHGLRGWAVPAGLVAGVAVSAMFYMRMEIESRAGKPGVQQPAFGGFELEDVLYLLPLVALAGQLKGLLLLAGIGAPLFALWVLRDYQRVVGRAPWLASGAGHD